MPLKLGSISADASSWINAGAVGGPENSIGVGGRGPVGGGRAGGAVK